MTDNVAGPAPRYLTGRQTYLSVGGYIADIAFEHPLRWRWWVAFVVSLGVTGLLAVAVVLLLYEGVGVWGNNIPVTWAMDIASYDWWIGIASGSLLISSTFLLLGIEWRGALNRITETTALIAAAAAGLYPIIHLGRPWFFYWNLPYPNTLALWPQFRSPLYWDAVDIISFLGIALSVWSIGLLPDLATLRDRAHDDWVLFGGKLLHLRTQFYGIAALGWRGSAAHWRRWTQAYRIAAGLGIVLVVSLQTGAAVMFAGSVEPGWHDTLLPFAFLVGAIYSGVAFMAAAAVLLRAIFGLGDYITARHLDILGWLMLGLGLLNLYCYAQEFFMTLMGGDAFDVAVLNRRFDGAHAWALWTIIVFALLPVHVFWLPPARRSPVLLFVVGVLVTAGIYADHFMVLVVTLQHDFLPSADHPYVVYAWEVLTLLGTVGLFFTIALLALRYVPLVSIVDVKPMASPDFGARHGQ